MSYVQQALKNALKATTAIVTSAVLVCADFAQIEARVLPWLAGQKDILEVFRSGQDVYVYTANKIGSKDRQLGKVCVLGLGFGMGPDKFIDTAATYGLKLDALFAEQTVCAWREANDKIVSFWWDLDRAFRQAIKSPVGTRIRVGEFITIERGKKAVFIKLPSGGRLTYRNARIEPDTSSRTGESIVFDGVQQLSKKWGPVRTYGGKLAENITQAVARDVMAAALLKLDAMGFDLRLTVHDEIIAVADAAAGEAVKELMLKVMRTPPAWAPGLPVGAEGWVGPRYKK